ncbi:helix-turn-helix domain-containing protein [Paenibacillus sp. MBLB4367]|uniref:helix-turn-helix domain-containing protein n=1 Tax=Paenibacillus sp. MBLB4367 TaxID=3384767 RepID=UPI00390811E9
MSHFSETLKELRTKRNVSQDDFSEYLGKTRATISNYENGKTEPEFADLVKIADFFNVTVDYLLGRKEAEKHYFDKTSIMTEHQALMDKFLKDTEAMLRDKGNVDEEKMRIVLKFMKFTFLEDLEDENRGKNSK